MLPPSGARARAGRTYLRTSGPPKPVIWIAFIKSSRQRQMITAGRQRTRSSLKKLCVLCASAVKNPLVWGLETLREDALGPGGLVAQRLGLGVLGRVVPPVGLLQAGELYYHHAFRRPIAFHRLDSASPRQVLPSVLLDDAGGKFSVLFEDVGIGDFRFQPRSMPP